MAARYYRDVDRARMDQVLEIVGPGPLQKGALRQILPGV